ncbi:hypothetical protein HOY80DRAFT_1136968 [Tuber brumale]|nr:hypothetical protein HOY80DRAFT_1136968 [Tuber brumale]
MILLLLPFPLLLIYLFVHYRKSSDPYTLDHKNTSLFPEACHTLLALLLEKSGPLT